MQYSDTRITRAATMLRRDLKLTVGRIFKENGILFNEEVFLQNTSIDWEQLVQEAFCYGTDIIPPPVPVKETLEINVQVEVLNV